MRKMHHRLASHATSHLHRSRPIQSDQAATVLAKINAIPDGLDVHIIMDNYATHKTAAVKTWLARRPHYQIHFTSKSASWINQVERWFAELTR